MKEYEALKGGRREKKIEEIAIEKCGPSIAPLILLAISSSSFKLSKYEKRDCSGK
jgi:hypothetical protein